MGAEVQKAQHEATRPALAFHRRATCTGERVRRYGAESAVAARQQCAEAAHCHPTGQGLRRPCSRFRARLNWAASAVGVARRLDVYHRAAQAGVTGPGERHPHHQAIQRSFGLPMTCRVSGRTSARAGSPAQTRPTRALPPSPQQAEHVGVRGAAGPVARRDQAAHVLNSAAGRWPGRRPGRRPVPARRARRWLIRVASGCRRHHLLAGPRAAWLPG